MRGFTAIGVAAMAPIIQEQLRKGVRLCKADEALP
jgi:hypothetical protein